MMPRPFGLRRIGLHRLRERRGMRSRQHRQAVEVARELRRDQPRQLAAPIVADQVVPLVAQRLHHGARIGDQSIGGVVFDLGRPRVRRVTALVRCHREITRRRQAPATDAATYGWSAENRATAAPAENPARRRRPPRRRACRPAARAAAPSRLRDLRHQFADFQLAFTRLPAHLEKAPHVALGAFGAKRLLKQKRFVGQRLPKAASRRC